MARRIKNNQKRGRSNPTSFVVFNSSLCFDVDMFASGKRDMRKFRSRNLRISIDTKKKLFYHYIKEFNYTFRG